MNARLKPLLLDKALMALSAANLIFLRQWLDIGVYLPQQQSSSAAFAADYWALMLNIILLASLLGALWVLAATRKSKRWEAFYCFLCFLLLLLPLNALRFRLNEPYVALSYWRELYGGIPVAFITAFAVLLILVGWYRFSAIFSKLTGGVLKIFFPLVILNFAKASWISLHLLQSPVAAPPTVASEATGSDRFFFLIFDAFDQRLAGDGKRPEAELPEYAHWRDHAIVATNAYPPTGCTTASMPAYHSGLKREVSVLNSIAWAKDSFLSTLRAQGIKTAHLGWYFPYCSFLGWVTDYCYHHPAYNANTRPFSPFLAEAMTNSFLNFLSSEFKSDGQWLYERLHLKTYQSILQHAETVIQNKSLRFALIHWPIPHPPWIFDQKKMDFSTHNKAKDGYLHNQQLVDKTLAKVRSLLQQTGQWDSSHILVTSDHWSHESVYIDGKVDHRIPWLLKLPYQKEKITYERPFNTVHARRFIEKWAARGLTDWPSVQAELEFSARQEVPPVPCEDNGSALLVSPY